MTALTHTGTRRAETIASLRALGDGVAIRAIVIHDGAAR